MNKYNPRIWFLWEILRLAGIVLVWSLVDFSDWKTVIIFIFSIVAIHFGVMLQTRIEVLNEKKQP